MEHSAVKKGMIVRIDKVCPKTDRVCGVVPQMKKYLNTQQKVDGIGTTTIRIRNFNWVADDVNPVLIKDYYIDKKQIPEKVGCFNPNELDL